MNDSINDCATAFMSPAFPVNPIPFASALADGVRLHGTDWIKSDKAKAILLVLNQQSYGQICRIDSIAEYERLRKVFRVPNGGNQSEKIVPERDTYNPGSNG